MPYAEVLDLAEAGDPAADRIVGTAARALGTLIAAVANIAMPELVILTGEGIRLAQVGPAACAHGGAPHATPRRPRSTSGCSTTTRSCGREGAAAVAIQRFVLDDLR